MTPSAFRFEGNSVFGSEELSALLAARINQSTDFAGLTAAARLVSQYYRAKGYLLTEAYLPEQAFAAEGGIVTIVVIEARIGRVAVQVDGDNISRPFVANLVRAHLKAGDAVTEYALDKPVLLLRDLAGHEASATVEPGARTGEVNVIVSVKAPGPRFDGSVSIDNHGARTAGAVRVMGNVNANNLLGRGDVLHVRAQMSDMPGSRLYRIAYTLPVGGAGTRLGVSAVHLDYALGGRFAALGASGSADVIGLSASHPLHRSRDSNLLGLISVEQKNLDDRTATPVLKSEREIRSLRVGLAGNFADDAIGAGALNSYALNATVGKLQLNPADLVLDQGAGGLHVAGSFGKLNLEYQRVQYLSAASSIHAGFQAQLASKNLSSAEKMALGGPTGVRGYPVGEGVGDAGALLNLEYRYQLPSSVTLAGESVSLLAFYDYGTVRLNQNGAIIAGVPNKLSLGSVGMGAIAGRAGHFLATAHLAWRTTTPLPATGDPDSFPRVWVSAQKWF